MTDEQSNNSLAVWEDTAQLAEVKKIYGEKLNEGEFTTFMQIGKVLDLNPFLKEIWAVKYGTSAASIFVGRDGYRKNAQKNPDYDYHLVNAVYENDEFSVDNSDVKHKQALKDRGALVGAYCIVKRKGSSKPNFNYVEMSEYDTKKSVWAQKPATMIKKVAEAQGLRMTFQGMFSGTHDESEQWANEPKAQVNVVEKVDVEDFTKRINEAKDQGQLKEVMDFIKGLNLRPEDSRALAKAAIAKNESFKPAKPTGEVAEGEIVDQKTGEINPKK